MATGQWDISSGSYASKSMSVASQATTPYGPAFSSDGTKAYVVDNSGKYVYQYTLSTAWDTSTGSYASKSMYVGGEELGPQGLAFSSDGTKAYVVGAFGTTVYQYTLSTAWDVSTGSYASKSMSVTAQDTGPYGLAFSSDGTKCYVMGNTNDTIFQYTLSTAWDISTGSYASKSMSVTLQDGIPIGLAFSSDGTKAYMLGTSSDIVYQYTLSTAWDISTGSYASKSMSVSTQETSVSGVTFSSDGTSVYVVGTVNDTVYQYDIALTYELTGTVKDPSGVAITNATIRVMQEAPWDISSGSYSGKSLDVSAQLNINGMAISPDGTKLYGVAYGGHVYQYDLSTAWDVSTGVYANKTVDISTQVSTAYGLAFTSDGMHFCVSSYSNGQMLYQYDLSIAWDVSTGVYANKTLSILAQDNYPTQMRFSADDTKIYVHGNFNGFYYQYTLSTPGDLSTGSYASKSLNVAGLTGTGYIGGGAFSSDGTKLYLSGGRNLTGTVESRVFYFTLSTAWDISDWGVCVRA